MRLTRENHAGRDLIVVFSRDVTEQKRLELRSRQNGRKLTESQRFANPGTTAMDVTEGTKIEEALKRSQDTRLTIDTIPTFAWCNRPDGSNEFLNQRWLDYTGLSIEAARDWGWKVAIHPEDLPRLLHVWQTLLARVSLVLVRFEPLFDETVGVLTSSGTVAFGIVGSSTCRAGYQYWFYGCVRDGLPLLLSAILWNLGTWYLGLPASSSHTLIGSSWG